MGDIKKFARESDAYKKLKAEVSRKASMANKRIVRLENNNLQELPAYTQWKSSGGVKFGVKGKNTHQLQSEMARLDRFLNARTSKVRDANKYMKQIADMTGAGYKSVKELPTVLKSFFNASSMVEQYLRQVEGSASAIGYHKIWDVVSTYVKENGIDLTDAKLDLEGILEPMIIVLEGNKKDLVYYPKSFKWHEI